MVRGAEDLHEVLPRDVAEVLAEAAGHAPHLGKLRRVLLLVGPEGPVEPREAPLGRRQSRGLLRRLEDVLVVLEDPQAELRDHVAAHRGAQGVHAAGRVAAPVVRQLMAELPAGDGAVVVQELLPQVAQHAGLALQEVRDARDVAELPEVAGELLHRVDQAGRLLIPALRGQGAKLLQRRDQHHEALQRRHREREVPLRDVEGLDVPADVADELLALLGLRLYGLDALEELADRGLGLVQVGARAPPARCLPADRQAGVLLVLPLLVLQLLNEGAEPAKGRLARELLVDVRHRVEVVGVQRVRRLRGAQVEVVVQVLLHGPRPATA
mmetsp:Transcript_64780/g.190007  ORF Transcript_64780/g.190007 Transcript_64780/m.190007 type:complete len:326 (+) Transcript_64780:1584-2561(+)